MNLCEFQQLRTEYNSAHTLDDICIAACDCDDVAFVNSQKVKSARNN